MLIWALEVLNCMLEHDILAFAVRQRERILKMRAARRQGEEVRTIVHQ